ncbi:MAG: Sec-independent protein translocase subunit TatB [Helicobacteraceae bacterium]|nr:Sec-independent protein translocase subunit TatB [Helicobacteraceae bacterium]
MFGMGFVEILIIAIIAVLFLGPDKLPEAMVQIAKFFRGVKKTVTSAKDALESELDESGLKESFNEHKDEFTKASSELTEMTSMDGLKSDINDLTSLSLEDEPKKETPASAKPEVVTFEKKPKTPPIEAV